MNDLLSRSGVGTGALTSVWDENRYAAAIIHISQFMGKKFKFIARDIHI